MHQALRIGCWKRCTLSTIEFGRSGIAGRSTCSSVVPASAMTVLARSCEPRAINSGGLDHYIAKPWDAEELHAVVREQLTRYVLAEGINPLPYLSYLDSTRAMDALRNFSAGE